MPFAAISYRVRPGHEDEIAQIFAGFRRVSSPTLVNDQGEQVGKLLGTAVFVKDDVLVRIIHYEGEFAAVAGHMAQQRGVHLLEQALAPFLAESRDTATADGFQAYFADATMRCVSQLSLADLPAGG
ncbi:SchA/CurD-like domain-containing protein [Kutzneria sp. NPDC052558]|uniref:SchA/CurD-like domain-containing protein n=1 Tax=Kutzneria sp. NPDC052558 TaxID=3364121 RepID=UPI0037CA4E92